jgi:hypothetical protein
MGGIMKKNKSPFYQNNREGILWKNDSFMPHTGHIKQPDLHVARPELYSYPLSDAVPKPYRLNRLKKSQTNPV